MALDLHILLQQTIKPSSPTPPCSASLRLSLSDQFTPDTYVTLVFFYPVPAGDSNSDVAEMSSRLKSSLSDTLTRFYPLAGRIEGNSTVECLDQGAQYIEARINCTLSGILENPDAAVLKQLLPAAIESNNVEKRYLLLVQASFFSCGGLALGVNITHKVADIATFSFFIKAWAATANHSGGAHVLSPEFKGASIFPPIEFPAPKTSLEIFQKLKCVTKRFVFDGSNIKSLQARISNPGNKKPTRVESVLVLIWKCAAKASRSEKGVIRPTACTLSVNIRKRLEPPLPETYAGNFVGAARAVVIKDEDLNLNNLFGLIRKDLEDFGEKYEKKIKEVGAVSAICQFAKDFAELAMDSGIDYYNCTSWCRFELYDADFGWGKPAWLASTSTPFKNVAVLMDTKSGDGIEVWLTLTEEDMGLFETDEELLEFAVVNPKVVA